MIRLLGLCALAVCAVTGCVSMPAPTYQASVDTTEKLLAQRPAAMKVGAFNAAPGAEDRQLNIRGSHLQPGLDGHFSTFLRNAVETELKVAGLLDPLSSIEISGTLTHNDLTAGTGKGGGIAEVSATFVVLKDRAVVLEQSFDARKSWDSSFMGALAVPTAMNNYSLAVQELIGQLFADPGFVSVTRP